MKYRYLFGPIASRRLGISLGVDLVRRKTCSLDCIYCEAGKTTALTLERREYVPTPEVLAELRDFLAPSPRLDSVTFSGAGEPTLHAGIGEIIQFLKREYPAYPVTLLTNALGFSDVELRKEVAAVDLCIPSLDASNEDEFQKINRPANGVRFDSFVEGLRQYTWETPSHVVLELFLVPGVNDGEDSATRFRDLISSLKIEKVQLNSLDRPPVEAWVKPCSAAVIHRFVEALSPVVPVEPVGAFCGVPSSEALNLPGPQGAIAALFVAHSSVRVAEIMAKTGLDLCCVTATLADLFESGLLTDDSHPKDAR